MADERTDLPGPATGRTAPRRTVDEAVTTVIIARNGGSTVVETMARHRGPVILIDNGSTDGSVEAVAEQRPQVRIIRLGTNRGAPARNVGVQLAATPYVAFADDDSWWAPGALDAAAAILDSHPRVAVVAARTLVGPENRLDSVCREMAGSCLPERPEIPGKVVRGFVACAAVVRKEAFLRSGGFDEVVFFLGEEERLTLDLIADGWELVYAPGVVAHHHPQSSRDRSGRDRLMTRNAVLTAVMRRSWPSVLQRVRTSMSSPHGRAGLVMALPRLVPALRARRRAVISDDPRINGARRHRWSAG